MKRIFIVFSLLLTLGVFAPMAKADNSFNAGVSLKENLSIWLTDNNTKYNFMKYGFDSPDKFNVALIYVSPELQPIYQSSLTDFNGFAFATNVIIDGRMDSMLDNFFSGFDHSVVESSQVYMTQGSNPLVYEWDNKTISLVSGIAFMGFTIGAGPDAMDIVVAFAPTESFATPVPAAVWLLGSGIAGLVALRRKTA